MSDPKDAMLLEGAAMIDELRQERDRGRQEVADLRAALTAEQLARDLGELGTALAAVDAADKACPIRHPSRRAKFAETCPKCGARASESCGPVICAEGDVVTAARALLAPSPAASIARIGGSDG